MNSTEDDQRRRWFREQILPLEPRLRSYAAQFRRGAEIDDLVQETFARAIACQTWRGVDNPASFARRILKNIVLDAIRRTKVVSIEAVADLDRVGGADDAPGPEAISLARDDLRRLKAVVERLPTQQRRVFTLRKIYEMSTAEIAARLGLSGSTIETQLAKALRTCAQELARDGRRHEDVGSSWTTLRKPDRQP